MDNVCITHGHSSYLCICENFGLFLPFKDSLLFYKNLTYEINLFFCRLMFFEAPKLNNLVVDDDTKDDDEDMI